MRAGVPDDRLVQILAGGGLNNIADESGTGNGQLREAVNVDLRKVFENGQEVPQKVSICRRSGYVKRVATTRGHSLWAGKGMPFLLYVDDGTLYAMARGAAPFVVQSGLAPREVAYALVNDRVFWSNGRDSGRVALDGTALPFAPEGPAGVPALSATATGGLPAGAYQVAVTFRSSTGEESGTGKAAVVDVAAGGGIALSAIPQPVGTDTVAVRLYASPADGDVLYHVRDVPVGMTAAIIGAGQRGKPLDTQFLEPIPPATLLRYFSGRLLAAVRNRVVWSEPLRYGLYRPTANYIRYADVTMIEPIGDGTDAAGAYLSDGKRTYWMAGPNPGEWRASIAVHHGAVRGSSCVVSGAMFNLDSPADVAYWLGSDGIGRIGLPGGQVLPVREGQVAAKLAREAATMVREKDGLRQIVTVLRDPSTNGLRTSDRATARVYRDGIEI